MQSAPFPLCVSVFWLMEAEEPILFNQKNKQINKKNLSNICTFVWANFNQTACVIIFNALQPLLLSTTIWHPAFGVGIFRRQLGNSAFGIWHPQFFIFHVARGPFVEEFYQCVTHGFYTADWQEQMYATFTLVFTFLLPLCILFGK